MPTANDVATYFIKRGSEAEDTGMSNLKLQKLLYYAQGYHLAVFNAALFDDAIEAWTHGPVCPAINRAFKGFGRGPIEVNHALPNVFTGEQLELLEEVYEVFGQFSAWKLRDMTHEETPWREHEAQGSTIPPAELQRYFATRLN